MLVWKVQTLNINVASLRYRCLFPLRYLRDRGIPSQIFGGMDTVKLTAQTRAIVFVKSFHHVDVETCERAYQQGIPIILDICDNIFIDGYGADSDHIPSENFRLMAQRAAAIVTTGSAMSAEVEAMLSSCLPKTVPDSLFGRRPIVVTIPDGSESLQDIQASLRYTQQKKRAKRIKLTFRPRKVARSLYKAARKLYKEGRRKAKVVFYGAKGRIGKVLRRYGLLAPLPASTCDCSGADSNGADSNGADSSRAIVLVKKVSEKNRSEPAPVWPKPWPADPELKTVLWFGNHGAKYGNFGMLNVLDVAEAIARVGQDVPLRLMVISNYRDKYNAYIAPLPFKTAYLPWHPRKIYDYIRHSDVVIVPNSQSRYSVCKSANRAVLSLSQGTPVVANRTPALDMLEGCVYFDDWESGLRKYLLNPEVAAAHVQQAQQIIDSRLSGEAIAQKWMTLLDQVAPLAPDIPPADYSRQTSSRKPTSETHNPKIMI